MQQGRLALARDFHDKPIAISRFCWSSAESEWAGLRMEEHELGPHGELKRFGVDHALMGLCVSGSGVIRVGKGTNTRDVASCAGRFTLLDGGYEQNDLAWTGTRRLIYLLLSKLELARLAGDDCKLANLAFDPQYGVADPIVAGLICTMWIEVREGCPCGRLYGESLSLALLSYLAHRYTRTGAKSQGRPLALSPKLAQCIFDYIEENLATDLSLSELARIANLSPHYFSLQFRHTFGDTPHQYVLSKRVNRARRMLVDGRLPISDVAYALGFADQSHFTRVFRRVTGTTPRRFRELSGNA